MTIRRLVPLLLLVLSLAACSKKVSASKEFKAAMDEFRPAMAAFNAGFADHERALQDLRDRDPAAAAAKIRKDVVPLVDRVARSIAKAREKGLAYLEVADGEDPTTIAKLRDNVAGMEHQAQAYERMRDAYARQADALDKGKLSQADRDAFVAELQRAMQLVAN